MKKKYLLPALKESGEVDAGIGWQDRENVYEYLIKELQLYFEPNKSIFDGGSNAFPHMFEQMLLFHRAFLDEKDPEHERAVLEWRAVLALMALQRVCNTKLDVIKVDFVEKTGNMFLGAARSFRPVDTPVFFNSTWDQIYLLMLWDTPIALFSPITLVCPAKQFLRKLRTNLKIEWISIGKVNGKEKLNFKFSDNGIEYENLVAWLKRLEDSLSAGNNEIDECSYKYERVKEELGSYCADYAGNCHQNTKILFKEDAYSCMTNTTRTDFDFLNFCCDVHIDNKKLYFLLDWYINDIFEQKLLVFVYDNMPDAMEREDYLPKIKGMFDSVLRIEGKRIIEVREYNGKQVAAYALLPLKQTLINELIRNHITPEEFFEKYEIIFYPSSRKIEISLKIKGFSYQFSMSYMEKDWQLVYGSDMENVYLWPEGRMRNPAWKMYYMYSAENKEGIHVSLPEAKEELKFSTPPEFRVSNCFRISRAESFPAFVKYSHKGVVGFLPVEAREFGNNREGKTAYVSLDIGHATSSVVINTNPTYLREQAENDNHPLVLPSSLKIAGIKDHETAVNYNFIGALPRAESQSYIKNMIHSFQKYRCSGQEGSGSNPIENGEILFKGENYLNDEDGQIVSYINFEYSSLPQEDRELAHIFVEQLLLFVTFQAYKQNCSFLDICFTHGFEEPSSGLGELEGLYHNALQRIQMGTGIMKTGTSALRGVPEYEALAYYVYQYLKTENGVEKGSDSSMDCVYVGVNIGWKNTWVSLLDPDSRLTNVKYLKMNYGGRNISLMDEDGKGNYRFKSYYKMLGILMSGGTVPADSVEEQLLDRFKGLYDPTNPQSKEYFQGIFDTIAMKIEENGYIVSPDVCNNVPYFRLFEIMITYNIILLLVCIAGILGKVCNKKKIKLVIGGNGAKFFQWVSNHKYNYKRGEVLEDEDSKRYWIISTEETILKYMQDASGHSDNVFSLQLVEDAAEQMIRGCSYWRMADMAKMGKLSFSKISDESRLDTAQCAVFKETITHMETDLFANINRSVALCEGTDTVAETEDTEKIIEESKRTDTAAETKDTEKIIEESKRTDTAAETEDTEKTNEESEGTDTAAETEDTEKTNEESEGTDTAAAEDAVQIIEERRIKNCRYVIEEIESTIGVE